MVASPKGTACAVFLVTWTTKSADRHVEGRGRCRKLEGFRGIGQDLWFAFLTMDSWHLEKEELEGMIQRLSNAEFTSDEDLEDARWLRTYLGKTGFVQLVLLFKA